MNVAVAEESGEWKPVGGAVSHFGPSPRDFVVWLLPGEVRWRVEVRDEGGGPPVAAPFEGRAVLRAGEETRAECDILPLRHDGR